MKRPVLQAGLTAEGARERDLLYQVLMKDCTMLMRKLCNKYSFIKRHEIDDYCQQMQLQAWEKFHYYLQVRRKNVNFQQWFYMQAKTAIFNYRAKLIRVSRHRSAELLFKERYRYIDNFSVFNIEDTEYNEDEYFALRTAIGDLRPEDRRVVEMYMEGFNMEEESIKLGHHKSYLTTRLCQAKNKIRQHQNFYFANTVWGKDQEDSGNKIVQRSLTRRVLQYNFEATLIREWDKIRDTEGAGFKEKQVQEAAASDKHVYAGYIWLYADATENVKELGIAAKAEAKRSLPKAIEQLTPDGHLVKRWQTITEAIRAGHNNIHRCLRGQYKQAGGYLWRYAATA